MTLGNDGADLSRTEGPDGLSSGPQCLSAGLYGGAVLLLVAAGSLSLFPVWLAMCHLWATDPLRSIGAAFPLVACAGTVVAWRRQHWSMNGTVWALPVIALSIGLARVVRISSFVVGYREQQVGLLNFGTVLFLYAVGAVLLFGGFRLLRASILPLCLLLFINPVPSAFNSLVDLPLQHLSASTARAFAHLIGLRPTGVQLRLMFAPEFGMFIAPGCNGVRGSITLGFLALIFGYVRRLRPLPWACTTLTAFLLGYALNLLRLCILVVYYRVGVSIPFLQRYGVGIDYAIGCSLFLFATVGMGLIIISREPSPATGIRKASEKPAADISWFSPIARGPLRHAATARALCFITLTFACIVPELRSLPSLLGMRPNEQAVLDSFPSSVGPYRLIRTWAEHFNGDGMIALALAEYSASPGAADTGRKFTFGLWVGSAKHLVANSKFGQGKQVQWTESFDALEQNAMPVHFLTSFYDDGISRQYDAESACSDRGCSNPLNRSGHEGFFLKAPTFSDLALAPTSRGKCLPILLRREWSDRDTTPSTDFRSQFAIDARFFMAGVDLRQLLLRNGSPCRS